MKNCLQRTINMLYFVSADKLSGQCFCVSEILKV